MSELYEQIIGDRGTLAGILGKIPGFKGYLDKGYRRTADRMIRDYVAGEVSKCVQRLTEIEKRILDLDGGLLLMSDTNSVKTKMQTFRDRVAGAAPGYSGFMAAIAIDAEALERIYAFDEAQIRYANRFNDALTALDQAVDANAGVREAVRTLDRLTVEANEAFSLRDQVLTNIDKALVGGASSDLHEPLPSVPVTESADAPVIDSAQHMGAEDPPPSESFSFDDPMAPANGQPSS